MDPKQLQARLLILRAGLIAALAILIGRLWYLQIAQWANYDRAAKDNRTNTTWTRAPRGTVYDRNEEVLADNKIIYQIQVTPTELPSDEEELNEVVVLLAAVLDVSTVEVEEAIEEARKTGTPDAVLPEIGDNIEWLVAIKLDERRSETPGVRVQEARRRHYPFGSLAAHVIGYARGISPEEHHDVESLVYDDPPGDPENRLRTLVGKQKVYAQDSTYGKTGAENMCEVVKLKGRAVPALQGRRGADEFEVDAFNQPRLIRHIAPVRGASVYLTLDRKLQAVAERGLAHPFRHDPGRTSGGGAAVLVDVQTGDILVMASHPSVDLNRYVKGFTTQEYDRIRNDTREPELNRAITGLYPTASTFKMITGCAILERTGINLGTTFTCTGRETFGKRHEVKKCWKRSGHGPVDFMDAVAESCDVYFWKAVKEAGLTADDIAEYARTFGFGEVTGSGLPHEKEGLVPTPEWKRAADKGRWYQGDTANLVIGQGDLQATPLQNAMAAAAVATGGWLPSARIIHKIVWPRESGRGAVLWPREEPRRIGVEPDTIEAMRRGMRATVVYRNGTARAPMSDLPVTVGAKTGSAEVRRDRDPHSWFVWFAPYEQPRYACAVIVEYGGYGSEVAGWVARDILLAAHANGYFSAARQAREGQPNAG